MVASDINIIEVLQTLIILNKYTFDYDLASSQVKYIEKYEICMTTLI